VRFAGVVYDPRTPAQASRLKEQIKARVVRATAGSHCAVLEEALAEAGLVEPAETAWPFLSADELSDLARRGVEIGNHSATHPNLVTCDDDRLDREVNGSRARLEHAVDRPVRFFSYPDGRFDRRVLSVTGAGHRAAMATWTSRAPVSALRIRRYAVGPAVDDLRSVLAPGYPTKYRRMALKWALRRRARRLGVLR
jgi:peptidoglycan/xylan/chitin deacetylase (PgdA/CDA1 family)